MKEIWKDIKWYEWKYEISDKWRIKSYYWRVQYLKNSINNVGYKFIRLTKWGRVNSQLVHRLLAIHFINNPNNKPCVNHIDGVKKNNKLENLEWCTYSENNQHAYDMGLSVRWYWKDSHLAKRVWSYINGELIKEYDSIVDAHIDTGANKWNISLVCSKKEWRKFAGGYNWKYL